MVGGDIKNNTASNGAGVSVAWWGDFTMNGGEIRENTATNDGGGINLVNPYMFLCFGGGCYCWSCFYCCYENWSHYFIIECSYCYTDEWQCNCWRCYAGENYEYTGTGIITMNGGTIKNNTANNGGGLHIHHRNENMPTITIENEVVFTGNVARNGLFINNQMTDLNPQIIPETVSVNWFEGDPANIGKLILINHAFTNYDINVEGNPLREVTFAVRGETGGEITVGGVKTVSGNQIGRILVYGNPPISFTGIPSNDGINVEEWFLNNGSHTNGPTDSILHTLSSEGIDHIEVLFGEDGNSNNNGSSNNNNGNNNEDDGEVKGEYRPENNNQGKGNVVGTNDPISSARYIVLIVIAMISLIVLLREKRK